MRQKHLLTYRHELSISFKIKKITILSTFAHNVNSANTALSFFSNQHLSSVEFIQHFIFIFLKGET